MVAWFSAYLWMCTLLIINGSKDDKQEPSNWENVEAHRTQAAQNN